MKYLALLHGVGFGFLSGFPGGTEHHVQSSSSFHTPYLKRTLLLALHLGVQSSKVDSPSSLSGMGAACAADQLCLLGNLTPSPVSES